MKLFGLLLLFFRFNASLTPLVAVDVAAVVAVIVPDVVDVVALFIRIHFSLSLV